MKYDYLIIGSGLYGSVFAHEMTKTGKTCLVIDKRNHLGGNVYCEKIDEINIHKYGAHIFHTSDKKIWNFVNSIVPFNGYINSPVAIFKNNLYNLPFNMNTFYQLWGVKTPREAKAVIEKQTQKYKIKSPNNLEEQALSIVGEDIYNILIKGYTEKQWQMNATSLPPSIIKRIPLRFTFNNNYFNDLYQGIPIGGYNKLIEGLLKGVDTKINTDFFKNRFELENVSHKILYTGRIDEYFDYKCGELNYLSLKFENETLNIDNFQGNAVINYTDKEVPYTRILEHKHFEFNTCSTTVITKEYPDAGGIKKEPYYPINNSINNKVYKKYQKLASNQTKVIFGGRLAEYKYYDMHHIIEKSIEKAQQELLTNAKNV